jgi:hypothetical protein
MSGLVNRTGARSGIVGVTDVIFSGYSATNVTATEVVLTWTENKDSHNAMASGVFTVPRAGIYQIILSASIFTVPGHENYAARCDIRIDDAIVSSSALAGYKLDDSRELNATAVYVNQLALGALIKIESFTAGDTHTIIAGVKTTLNINGYRH